MRAAILALLLSGCVTTGGTLDPGNPVAIASCPEVLPALVDPTFGATVNKLTEVAGIYFKCRAAAVGKKE